MPGNTSKATLPVPGSFTAKLKIAKAKELGIERSRLKNRSRPLQFRPSKPIGDTGSALPGPITEHGPSESQSFNLDTQSGLNEETGGDSLDHEASEGLGYQAPNSHAVKNRYAGLISVKKRKRAEQAAASDLIVEGGLDIMPVSVNVGDSYVRKKRPFAPAKKPARMHRPTNGSLCAVGILALLQYLCKAPFEKILHHPSRPSWTDIIIVALLKPDTRTTLHSSDWYQQIDMKVKYSRSDLESLKRLSSLISDCVRQRDAGGDLESAFSRLRQRIHQMEFYDFLSGILIKKSKVLEKEGLPAIFEGYSNIEYPWDIRCDSQALYHRWLAGILDPYLLVGIDTKLKNHGNGKESKARSLQRDYSGRVSCNKIGDNDIQNGMWWPYQMAAMRDGAHGEIEAGIHGQSGEDKGAYSIVLSSGGYADVDEGEIIHYCGTSGTGGQATTGTKFMKVTAHLRNPVRVLRSAALPAGNPYRPLKGIRYDGLYDIVSYKVLDVQTAMHQFHLTRRPGQDPIRYQGIELRPTWEQLEEYNKIRKLLGLNS